MSNIIIDAVYTWVDMSDQKWLDNYRKTTGRYPESMRYKNYGELEFSVKLLIKHCKFIRNIYIVTDNQTPSWYETDKEKYPNVFIIDHSIILDNLCSHPTFKSDSIEAYLYKIPDLSEYYLYLNDDTFIGNVCTEYNFIDRKTLLPIARFKQVPLSDQMKAAAIAGRIYPRAANLTNAMNCVKRAYKIHHNKTPIHQVVILRKSMSELAWKLFPNELTKSVRIPIRTPINDTISFTLLSMLLGITTGKMKTEIGPYSIKIYDNYSLSKGGATFNLNRILAQRPQLFCINDVNDYNYRLFDYFTKIYIT